MSFMQSPQTFEKNRDRATSTKRVQIVMDRFGDTRHEFDVTDAQAVALAEEARLLLTSAPDGADALLARLDRLEQRLAGRPRGVPAVDPLTDREVGVLRLLRGTLSIREIGETLNLSQNTVKTHTSSIYRKLGVSSRHDAIRRGISFAP